MTDSTRERAAQLAQYIYDNCSNGSFQIGLCENVIAEAIESVAQACYAKALKAAKRGFNSKSKKSRKECVYERIRALSAAPSSLSAGREAPKLCAYCGHAAHLPSDWSPSVRIRLDKDTCQWGEGKATCNCPHQIPYTFAGREAMERHDAEIRAIRWRDCEITVDDEGRICLKHLADPNETLNVIARI